VHLEKKITGAFDVLNKIEKYYKIALKISLFLKML
jgi:hypothetical protein